MTLLTIMALLGDYGQKRRVESAGFLQALGRNHEGTQLGGALLASACKAPEDFLISPLVCVLPSPIRAGTVCGLSKRVQTMPIYEYCCEDCSRLTSQLVLKPSPVTPPKCCVCGSSRTQRVLSGFAYHRSEANRLAEFDLSASSHPNFYKDSRNIGLWAKKRAQDMGVDLGPSFEETVEKARTGKILDEV